MYLGCKYLAMQGVKTKVQSSAIMKRSIRLKQ